MEFPLAMLTRKLGPALAAGCTGLIKPASNTPLSAFALLQLAQDAGVPDGVINGVAGDTGAISEVIMTSDAVRKVSFTGSTEIGKTLVRNSADTMKKVSMELGGNAPISCLTMPTLRRPCRARSPVNSAIPVRSVYVSTAFTCRTGCTRHLPHGWWKKCAN